MHILVISPGFPADENDTDCIPPMQIYFQQFKKKYPEIKISVISIHYPFQKKNYLWNEIKVYACGASNRKQPFRLFYWLRVLFYTIKINKECSVDIIHSFWFSEAAFAGNIARNFFGVRHINTLMGQDVLSNNRYLKFLPLKKIFTVAVSERQADVFKESTTKPVNEIVPWGIEKMNLRNDSRDIDILGVGSLIPVKNFLLFIEILNLVKNEFSSLNCFIIGEGSERKKLEKQISRLGLEGNIKLTGHLPHEEVLLKMQKSKILLHTSNYESFGYVIIEALAAGCYVVCKETGCAAASDRLFIAKTDVEFSREIVKLLKGKMIVKSVNPFTLDYTLDSYYKIYNNVR